MPEQKKKLTKEDVTPTCQNCDFEEYDNHVPEGICPRWRPDLEYKRMLDSVRKENSHE